jgi:c-di-GMP-binding flagellar brake protein YcgR
MSGPERRRHKRVNCSLPVQLYVQGQAKPIQAEVKNISVSGAFVQSGLPIPAGEKVLLEFQTSELNMIHARIAAPASGADDNVSLNSTPRWVERTSIGVEFVNVRPEVKQFLTELIDVLEAKSARR